MILLSQWYEPKNATRLAELKRARDSNESSGLFSDVVYLTGASRRTFNDFFDLAAKNYHGQPCIVANTDIEFDDTVSLLEDAAKPMRLIALTRWNTPASPDMLGWVIDGRFFSGRQDSWCFVGGGMPTGADPLQLGCVGCDQAILGWAMSNGCEIFDPAIDIRTWHIHDSEERETPETFASGLYAYPELTTLISNSGSVAYHDWPSEDGGIHFKMKATCRP
jgi:hypothetical protein